jgi:hypothetical protein
MYDTDCSFDIQPMVDWRVTYSSSSLFPSLCKPLACVYTGTIAHTSVPHHTAAFVSLSCSRYISSLLCLSSLHVFVIVTFVFVCIFMNSCRPIPSSSILSIPNLFILSYSTHCYYDLSPLNLGFRGDKSSSCKI